MTSGTPSSGPPLCGEALGRLDCLLLNRERPL
jgi:hypothetical protein